MKISKAAWHYRFNEHMSPISLETRVFTTCSYIRFTLWNMVEMAIALSAAIFVAVMLIGAVLCMVYAPIALVFGLTLPAKVAVMASVWWMLLSVVLAGIGAEKLRSKWVERREEKELGLLLQAAQDRKNGVCTLVEFE